MSRCCDLFDVALADQGVTGETASRFSTYFRAATARLEAYPFSERDVPRDVPFDYAPTD